jgi:MoaA/NifB/PqqE/SkfB family radical SAM enzyme
MRAAPDALGMEGEALDGRQKKADVLMLHLLGRCNLECAHCYMEGSPRRSERLPLDAVLGAVGECSALGIGSLSVTGGEPLLYPHLERVLRAARTAAPGLEITLCTNGTLLTTRHAARLKALDVRLNISVDGRPEFHDRFRNSPGAFAETERGVRIAVEHGLRVTIISSFSRRNLDAVEFLVGWAADAGARHFFAQPLLNLGRGRQISDDCLSFDQLNRLILTLSDVANKPRHRSLECQVIGPKKQFLMQHPCGAFVHKGIRCHRGVTQEIRKLVVREDGTVLPEVPNLNARFALGNIADASLSALIDRYFEHGYDDFEHLCRATYARVLPTWDCVIVPWEQILSEASETWTADAPDVDVDCAGCTATVFGAWAAGRIAEERPDPAGGRLLSPA